MSVILSYDFSFVTILFCDFIALLQDQVLSSMQQKLDTLCELVNNSKEYSTTAMKKSCDKDGELQLNETFGTEKVKFVDCGCWHCEQHSAFINEVMVKFFIVSFFSVVLLQLCVFKCV